MIAIGTIGIRYLETALLGLLVLAVVLLFLRRRPPGLVWYSALAMAAMAVHLFLEEGRWQLAPAYLLLFVLCFWLARPSRRSYRVPGLVARIIVALVAVPALLLPVAVPLFIVRAPEGPHRVGTATIRTLDGRQSALTVWYPATEASATVAPYWSEGEMARNRLPGFPAVLATHLALVPTPAGERGPIRDGELPLLLVMPGEGSLPGDYLHLILEAASAGWFVVGVPGQPDARTVLEVISRLTDPETDAATAGRVDSGRAVLLATGVGPMPDLGLPSIRIAGDSPFEAELPDAGLAVYFPEAEIPPHAFTMRYLMVRPSRLLVGSSDIAPGRLDDAMRHLVRTILSDGSAAAPVFSVGVPDQSELLGGVPGSAIRRLPAARR